MNKNTDQRNDLEYIRSLFDADDIKAPGSLSEDSVLEMISHLSEEEPASESEASGAASPETDAPAAEITPVRAKKRFALKKWIAAAACLVVAFTGTMQIYQAVTAPPDTTAEDGELYTFRNQSEISRLVSSLDKSSGSGLLRLGRNYDEELIEDAEMAAGDMDTGTESAPSVQSNSMAGPLAKSSGDAPDHSDTYLQVDEVDEADIVKTDGKYIYCVTETAEVVILSADSGMTRVMSRIGASDIDNYIEDIYIKGNTLITVGYYYDDDDMYTGVVTYDISDRSSPQLITSFRQTGDIISSRMVGDYVYLVTNDAVYKGGRVVPKCMIGGEFRELPTADICCVPDPQRSSYIVLSAIDITSGKSARSKTTAIFGASQDIYCNDHNLYSSVYEWDPETGDTYTRIVRAGLDGLKVKFNATARVRGYIDDQFSMDEKDGYFRIATTSERAGMDVNNMFVLDRDLRETGKITGFARNESIRAVRYYGDKAYVITYEQIDPLFIIDLSDPASPRIEGEVKIDGFSTLLVPAGEGRLLGIGHATGDNGYGGEYDSGLKLVLFDISNPSEPKVIASREFEDMSSPAQDTHKALTVNAREGWYAIPYGIYRYDDLGDDAADPDEILEDAEDVDLEAEDIDADVLAGGSDDIYQEAGYEAGVLVFGSDDDLPVYDQHKLSSRYLARSVYIGDYIYALDEEGSASSFRFSR